MRRRPAWRLALALAGLAAGCGRGSPPETARPQSMPFEYSGCAKVMRGPVCDLGASRTLRLWIGAPPGAVVTVGGRPPAKPPEPLAGGLLIEHEVPPGAREALVEAQLGDERRVSRLALAESRPPQWFEAALALGKAGDLAAAQRAVEPKLASRVPAERSFALMVAVQVDLVTGPETRAEERLRSAIAAHRASGLLSEQIKMAAVLAQRLIQRRAFGAARAVLDACPDSAGHSDSAFHQDYSEGLLAAQTGDLRQALRQLRAALEHAERTGAVRSQTVAGQVLARELQRVGRASEAASLFAELERTAKDTLPPCDLAQLRNNRAWAWLLEGEAGTPAGDPQPLLVGALRVFDEECQAFAGGEEERVNVRVNLALHHLQTGNPDEARRLLTEARRLDPEPGINVRLWWADLEARMLLDTGRAGEALVAFRELAERARAVQSPEGAWRASYGEARARSALGDVPGALAAYAAAETLLERESLLVPMHEGRDTFVGQREAATRRHLDLLLRAGRSGEALAAARRGRAQTLRRLRLAVRLASLAPAQRSAWEQAVAAHDAAREKLDRAAAESWRLPGSEARRALDEGARHLRDVRSTLDALLARFAGPGLAGEAALRSPAPGEVLLAYHPLPDGWVGFAADERGVVARRLGRLEDRLRQPAALAARVLVPFAAQVRRARRVRVLSYGALRAVDFHALPFDGDALLAAKPVVYALDLPPAAMPARRGGRALVVGDPAGDLPGARAEARRTEAALAAADLRWTIERLLGSQASGPAVRRALVESALFHYAGHAVAAGWDSSLPLAGGGRLTVDDVLALRRSPAWVVLAGCATGATAEASVVESMSLANAFLSAGAQAVIAAVRPLPDREAAALVEAFYAELPRAASPAEALRSAQLARRGRQPNGAWASFRAFVP